MPVYFIYVPYFRFLIYVRTYQNKQRYSYGWCDHLSLYYTFVALFYKWCSLIEMLNTQRKLKKIQQYDRLPV